MTQEQKDLLFKELCLRLPYGVKVQFKVNRVIENKNNYIYNVDGGYEYINTGKSYLTLDIIKMLSDNCIDEIKPYLFPLSSMTEEQRKEFDTTLKYLPAEEIYIWTLNTYDWFNKNHFDYRGLIPMGLANDATKLKIY